MRDPELQHALDRLRRQLGAVQARRLRPARGDRRRLEPVGVAGAARPRRASRSTGTCTSRTGWGHRARPADPATIQARANKLFDFAVAATGCATPWIAENELFGARADDAVVADEHDLPPERARLPADARGARRAAVPARQQRPVHRRRRPATGGARSPRSRTSSGRSTSRRPRSGSRARCSGRASCASPSGRGSPASLRSGSRPRGSGSCSDSRPRRARADARGSSSTSGCRPSKWQALAARQAAEDLHSATVWSWGWGTFGTRGVDPDKPAAACVYLWTRSPTLCDGPSWAGDGFDASLTEGQIRLPSGIVCSIGSSKIAAGELGPLVQLTGDRDLAFTALLERIAERRVVPVSTTQILAAERTVIAARFGGSAAAYRGALAAAHATVPVARADPRRPAAARPDRGDAPEVVAERSRDRDVLPRLPGSARALGGDRAGRAVARRQDQGLRALRAGARCAVRPALGRPLARCAR